MFAKHLWATEFAITSSYQIANVTNFQIFFRIKKMISGRSPEEPTACLIFFSYFAYLKKKFSKSFLSALKRRWLIKKVE